MTVEDLRVTVGESYGLATHTSNLRVQEKRTDADMILAAGMVSSDSPGGGHDLGVLLLRLHSEFDTARAALMRVDQEMPRYQRAAAALERRAEAWKEGQPSDPATLRSDAQKLREMAKRRAVSEAMLVLMDLKTVRPARQAVLQYADKLAQKERFREPPDVLERLAYRVLDVLLDPTCHTCWGTGSEGSGYQSQTMRVCGTCGGSGHRRDSIGNGPRARWFAFILLGNMQREMAQAAGGIGRKLRSQA